MDRSPSRTLTNPGLEWGVPGFGSARAVPHLVIAWSRDEPHRIGEAAPIAEPCVLGRRGAHPDDPEKRAVFEQQRRSGSIPMPPLEGNRISRRQLELVPLADGRLEVRSVGRCAMILHGDVAERGVVGAGDTIVLQDALVLLVVPRLPFDPIRSSSAPVAYAFGAPDPHGFVGESRAAWALRAELTFAGKSGYHTLILGPSGAGKELAARAVHAMSPRCDGPFVARNAATFPEGLIDAELFGSAKGFPHAGSPERPGLVGEADGGTLFLDEIGELPLALHARLLRVLDLRGEYQRLGETRTRASRFRLVAATNRPVEALKHDLCARFVTRVHLPGLEQRRDDVPLLLRHLLSHVARANPEMAAQFFEQRGGAPAEARVDPRLVEALLHHPFTTHVRELERLVWVALGTSRRGFLTITPELRVELGARDAAAQRPSGEAREDEPPAGDAGDPPCGAWAPPETAVAAYVAARVARCAEIEAALVATGGNVSRAARLLGSSSRFALYREMKQLGLGDPKDYRDRD